MPNVVWGLIHRMVLDGRTGNLFCLTSLNRGFLISTDHPCTLLEQGSGLFIQTKYRLGTLQKCLGLLNVLPGMEPPGADLLGGEPPPNGPG